MRKVVSFIDEARVRKLSMIRIVHGAGSFALKNAVWKYLGNHKDFIKDYRLGGQGEGGLGATIVHLK
jgi:DNA mismatch repair protein MutS2